MSKVPKPARMQVVDLEKKIALVHMLGAPSLLHPGFTSQGSPTIATKLQKQELYSSPNIITIK